MSEYEGNGKKITAVFLVISIIIGIGYFVFVHSNLLASSDLKDKSSSVGNQFYSQYIHSVKIDEIYGYSNTDKTHIEYLSLSIHYYVESEEIDLRNCTVTTDYNTLSTLYFDETLVSTYITIFNNYIINSLSSSNYGVISATDADNSIDDRFGLTFNDKAFILLNLSLIIKDGGLAVGNSLSGEFIVDNSHKIDYSFTVPKALSNRVVKLY